MKFEDILCTCGSKEHGSPAKSNDASKVSGIFNDSTCNIVTYEALSNYILSGDNDTCANIASDKFVLMELVNSTNLIQYE